MLYLWDSMLYLWAQHALHVGAGTESDAGATAARAPRRGGRRALVGCAPYVEFGRAGRVHLAVRALTLIASCVPDQVGLLIQTISRPQPKL